MHYNCQKVNLLIENETLYVGKNAASICVVGFERSHLDKRSVIYYSGQYLKIANSKYYR